MAMLSGDTTALRGLLGDPPGLLGRALVTGESALATACSAGSVAAVRLVLEVTVCPDPADDSTSPLIVAAAAGRADLVASLVGAGAGLNRCAGSTSALVSAAAAGHTHVVQALVAAGASPDLVSGGATRIVVHIHQYYAAMIMGEYRS